MRDTAGSLRAKWSPGEPCGDKGIGSYVVDSEGRLKRARKRARERRCGGSRTRSKSNTVGRSRLVSFRFMNGKSAGALERVGNARECQRVNLDPAMRTRGPSRARHITSANGPLPRRDKCGSNWRYIYCTLQLAPIFDYRIVYKKEVPTTATR